MKYPSEEEIAKTAEELFSNSSFHHQNVELYGECDMCNFDAELDSRCREKNGPSKIDSIMINTLQNNMALGIAVAIGGGESIHKLIMAIRAGFYIGYKIGLQHSSIDELENLMKE